MAPNARIDSLHELSVRTLATAIRRRELSSEAVVRACLERIEEVNGRLNAVVAFNADAAIARARAADAASARGEHWGPLHGVPMTIKDSLDTAGLVTTGGTLGRAAFVPREDATVVARLRHAGAVLIGKTNTPEFTLSFETSNLVYGRTSNPYDSTRSAGGSSGGAAAIVAAGGSPFDIGSDFGGSIRVPAHSCGIAGIKPTSGRVPRTGHVLPFGGLLDWFQQIGPLARYVDDLALLLPLIAGPDHVDPAIVPMPWQHPATVDVGTLRVAVHADNGVVTPTDATLAAVERARAAVAAVVREIDTARPAGIEESLDLALSLFMCDGGATVRRLLREAGTNEHTLEAYTTATPMPADAMDALIARWYAFRSRLSAFMADYDAILCPVNANPALPHGAIAAPHALAAYSYTMTYNLTGWPAAVVRAGTSPEGLPIGIQIVARPGREDVALALASVVERALGGFQAPAP